MGTINSEVKRQVLAIDNDFISRRFMELSLQRAGYEIRSIDSVLTARKQIEESGPERFSCLITNYQVTDGAGIELLQWLKNIDPTLATIVIANEAEQHVVEETMRAGACDFLNKPFARDCLQEYVSRAVRLTETRRHLASIAHAVEEVGRINSWMIRAGAAAGKLEVELVCLPKHQAGGDFFSCYPVSETCTAALMTDVSGHDLKAAYISAYLQGMVRAMLESNASLSEVFDRSNAMLTLEWGARADSVSTSVAASSLLIDSARQIIHVITSGAPAPLFTDISGRSELLGSSLSPPLGWFRDFEAEELTRDLIPGYVTLWTDGVPEIAEQMSVSVYAISSALLINRAELSACPWISHANDDIMTARVNLQRPCESSEPEDGFYLVAYEIYAHEDARLIDEMQKFWEANLLFVIPDISRDVLYSTLVCVREMVLNALRHGCQPGEQASVQFAWAPSSRRIRVFVDDPGPGHEFAVDAHEDRILNDDYPEGHYGLIMVRHLTDDFRVQRRGASIRMDFKAE